MNFKSFLLTLTIVVVFCYCKKGNENKIKSDECVSSQTITPLSIAKQDEELLKQLWDEIVALSGSANCQRANGWGITPVGTKPCGGPWTYLAYRLNTDVECLMKKINHYNEQQKSYNIKYGIGSDCSVPPVPKAVECRSGVPVFVY